MRAAWLACGALTGTLVATLEHACAPAPARIASPPRALPRTPVVRPRLDASASLDAAVALDAARDTNATPAIACPADMVPVQGAYCPTVEQECLQWDSSHWRCMRFAEPSRCTSERRPMAFCIDRLEWPNRAGAMPRVMVTWLEAQEACRSRGRRLCTQSEWTFACEGEDMVPYGYGYARTPGTCTVDHPRVYPDEALLRQWPGQAARDEVERLYEAAPTGSHRACRTPFGALDMIGNVDEWVVNERAVPFVSALQGGWWTTTRSRCRAVTLEHYQRFRYYQIGFRCCADAGGGRE